MRCAVESKNKCTSSWRPRGVLKSEALGFFPSAGRQMTANGFADLRGKQDVAMQAKKMPIVGEVRDRLDVLASLAHRTSSEARTRERCDASSVPVREEFHEIASASDAAMAGASQRLRSMPATSTS